jgi:cellulose synthase/poly-beta-1,6-N-acetylglucosamine synthase-like glycosyltransferase
VAGQPSNGVAIMSVVSVLTPSFDYAWCIEDALSSVSGAAANTPSDWEVEHVVVDDGSQDQSRELLARWSSRLVLELQLKNRGQAQTLNRCLSLASGSWIGWLNADDFYLPWSLRDACAAFTSGVDVLHGDAVALDRSARFRRLIAEHPFSYGTLRWWGTYLPVGAVFIRRSVLEALRWREDLTLLLDWDLWLRAAEAGARFRYIPSSLAAVRWHPDQESRQDRPERLAEKARVRRDHRLPSRPWQWRTFQRIAALDHGARKAITGGYRRQKRTASLRGRPMRWFSEAEAWSTIVSLSRKGYGREVAEGMDG